MRFLGYIILNQDIWIEDEKIEAVKNWPKPKSVQDIQVFIDFAYFYRRFIRAFSSIAAPLTSILKTTGLSNLAPRELKANKVVRSSGKANDRNLSKSKNLKNAKSRIQTCIGATREPIFLTLGTREIFNQLRQAFIEAPILQHFDLEYYIQIETNALGYTIGEVLS